MELSKQEGNPAYELNKIYPTLNNITDEREFYDTVMAAVKPTVGKGMSKRSYNNFVKNLNSSARRGLMSMHAYVTNFIVAADGLRVIENEIAAIGSLIREDKQPIKLTPRQAKLKRFIESNSKFFVTLVENPISQNTLRSMAPQATRTNPIDSYVMYNGDGPTTPFVIISRLFELVEKGKLSSTDAANYAEKYGVLKR